MEKFQRIESVAVPMDRPNIDTDQIIPARFIRKPRKLGMAQYAFHDLRFNDGEEKRPDFVLNQPPYQGAQILVAERNFGCGSSREHAVYALFDFGIRAIVAPSFGDIFFNNALQNGLLPVAVPHDAVVDLLRDLQTQPGARMTVDLPLQIVIGPKGHSIEFEMDPFRKHCLLEGVDEIGFTLRFQSNITDYESQTFQNSSWI